MESLVDVCERYLNLRVVACGCLLTLLVASLYRQWAARATEKRLIADSGCKDPPTLQYKWPLALDLILEAFAADRAGTILDFFDTLINRTGNTFEQVSLGARGINTVDPRVLESILTTKFTDFDLGARPSNFRPLLGHGIFTQDGAAWKTSRDLLRPQFMQIRSEAFADIQDVIERFVSSLKNVSQMPQGAPVDLQPLFFRLTLDTTMAVLFGEKLDSGYDDEAEFAKAFDAAQHTLAQRGRLGHLYWLMDGLSFRRSCRKVHRFVDGIVARALANSVVGEKPKDEEKEPARFIFLKALVAQTRDPIVLRDHMINVLLAGRDTTACLLSWTFYLLARHPEVQSRLREECLSLPSQSNSHQRRPTAAEIKQAKYLNWVLAEVLRLYPSVPVNSRSAERTVTLPYGGGPDGNSPLLIRKGEAVGYSTWTMHRRRDLYGDDADQFRPERWDPASRKNLKRIGYGYLPFHGGPRTCPGQEFALLEAGYGVARLMQEFGSVQPAPGSEKQQCRQNVTLVMSNRDGCKVVLV